MPDTFIPLEDAAKLENVTYDTMQKRVKRDPILYKAKSQPRENGGKDAVLVSTASLSPKARRAWRASQKADGRDAIIEQRADSAPWYVGADLNHYIEKHKKAYYEAVELAGRLQELLDYDGPDRTGYTERFALDLGVSTPTLYRYTQSLLEANAWASKLEREDGQSYDYFRPLSLCRKPKETATFPSLSDEQKAIIENIWFDKHFSQNLGTREMLYEKFQQIAEERGWEDYPSCKTVGRYVSYLMSLRGSESTKYLAANGTREWKNKMMLKAKRTTKPLSVMEYVVGDEHTFDVWVQWTAPNGKVKAVRPVLVAWEELKSRRILGDVMCVTANSQTLKQSFIKMAYKDGIPQNVHVDNGKDYTSEEMTGTSRKNRKIAPHFSLDDETKIFLQSVGICASESESDSAAKGFYQSVGVQDVSRSLPFQPWDKLIERFFNTVCNSFSKWFESYTGTLTGSKTYAKRKKDVDGMLERGELLTLEEFFDVWSEWKEKYEHKPNRGLIKAGEDWTTPAEVWENAPRYEKAAPPREYAAMLLMKGDRARVSNQGINKFGVLYADTELGYYVGKTVNVKWDIDDVSKLYVYDLDGHKICEAVSAEVLSFGPHCSQAALTEHMKNQKNQYSEVKAIGDAFTMPYEERMGLPSDAIGGLDLTIKGEHEAKIVALPQDREYRAEVASGGMKKKRSASGDKFLEDKAGDALARLRAMNE